MGNFYLKIDLLRKLIREEVKAALREELPKVLSEIKTSNRGVNNVIKEIIMRHKKIDSR